MKNIKDIKIQIIQTKECSLTKNNGHYKIEDFSNDEVPGGLEPITFLIKGVDYEKGKELVIGTVDGYLIDFDFNFKVHLIDFDEISGSMYEFCETMIKTKSIPFVKKGCSTDYFLFIDSINVDDKYKNQGIGTTFFKNIEEILMNFQYGYVKGIVLKAFPTDKTFNDSDWNSLNKRLKIFYSRNGFLNAKDKDYMYLIFEDVYNSLND